MKNNQNIPAREEQLLQSEKTAAAPLVQSEAPPVEDEEIKIPVPPVAEPFSGMDRKIAYFGFSQQGQSHIRSEKPCQDRCCHASVSEKGVLVTAVADGVGSCALSDLGAHTAVHSSVEFIREKLQSDDCAELDNKFVGTLLRSAMQHAYDQVIREADKHEQLLYSFQSTLTIAIYDGVNLYFAHAGDDGIVALTEQRTLAMATTRHKGEEASSVFPLQSKNTWQFGMVPNTVAYVMATDGVLDAFVLGEAGKNKVYYPFLEPIFTAEYKNRDSVRQVCDEFYAYMSGENYRKTVTDDLSLVAVMNLEKLPRCLPEFDLDAWNAEIEQNRERIRQALYGSKEEPARNRNREDGKKKEAAPAAQRNPRPAQPEDPDRGRICRTAEPDTDSRGGKSTDRKPVRNSRTAEDDCDEYAYYSPYSEYGCSDSRTADPGTTWDDWPPPGTGIKKKRKPADKKSRETRKKNPYSEAYWLGVMTGLSVAMLAGIGFWLLKVILAASWLFG